jgi:nucleotide-binding universal stress UspA family protein
VKSLLAAVDFSGVTERILDVIEGLPDCRSAHVYLLHVAEPDPDFVGWEAGPAVVRDQIAAQFHREHREIEALAARLRGSGITVTALLIQGAIVDAVLHQADKLGASLIVVGSHGHGAAYDLLVGSVSAGVIRRAQVPVLVVPARGAGAGQPPVG